MRSGHPAGMEKINQAMQVLTPGTVRLEPDAPPSIAAPYRHASRGREDRSRSSLFAADNAHSVAMESRRPKMQV